MAAYRPAMFLPFFFLNWPDLVQVKIYVCFVCVCVVCNKPAKVPATGKVVSLTGPRMLEMMVFIFGSVPVLTFDVAKTRANLSPTTLEKFFGPWNGDQKYPQNRKSISGGEKGQKWVVVYFLGGNNLERKKRIALPSARSKKKIKLSQRYTQN